MEYQEILKLIAEKDKTGLEALYTTYGKKFYTYGVKKWSLNEDEAWDVVYRTLETLVLKLSTYTFESKAHFDNFIFKVFTNFLKQHFRSHRKHQFKELSIGAEFNTYTGTNEEDKNDQIAEFEMDEKAFREYYKSESQDNPKLFELENALDKLDEIEKSFLLLRAQNYSYDEIASMLNIENNQLKVKHHRAKQKLLQLLSKKTGSHV